MVTQQTEVVQRYRPLAALVPAHWQAGFVEAQDGTRLHYTRTGGDKPALVLLHGVQADGLTWLRVAKAFEANFDVVMPDFRGHGESGGVEKGASAEILVNDTISIIKALDLNSIFVVGHSMGADIAGRLGAKFTLKGVILVDPALRNFMGGMALDVDNPPQWMKGVFDTLRSLKALSHGQRMLAGQRLMMTGNQYTDESDYVSFIDAQAKFDLEFYRHMAAMGYLFESPDVIAKIDCAVLLLTAKPMMPNIDIERDVLPFTENARDIQHVHFADSGHAIMFDQFEKFVAAVKGFVGE